MNKIDTFDNIDMIEQKHYKFIKDVFYSLDIKNEVYIIEFRN